MAEAHAYVESKRKRGSVIVRVSSDEGRREYAGAGPASPSRNFREALGPPPV